MGTDSVGEGPGKPARRVQFSVRDLLALMLALGVLLALTVQLAELGFVAACFLVAIGGALRFRKWRLFLASLTALLVYATTYLASWVQFGYGPAMSARVSRIAEHQLPQIAAAVAKFAETHGGYPDTLQQLAGTQDQPLWFGTAGELSDLWGHPFHYRKTAAGFELASLGRDGRRGGVGFDADIFAGDGLKSPRMRLPLSQFLFEAEGRGGVWLAALLASWMAGQTFYEVRRNVSPPTKFSLAGVAVTTVAAVAVALFLAAFYVAASQSGH